MSFSGLLTYMEDLVRGNPSVILPDAPSEPKNPEFDNRRRKMKKKALNKKIKDYEFTTSDLCFSI